MKRLIAAIVLTTTSLFTSATSFTSKEPVPEFTKVNPDDWLIVNKDYNTTTLVCRPCVSSVVSTYGVFTRVPALVQASNRVIARNLLTALQDRFPEARIAHEITFINGVLVFKYILLKGDNTQVVLFIPANTDIKFVTVEFPTGKLLTTEKALLSSFINSLYFTKQF